MSSENIDVLLPFEVRLKHYELALSILRTAKESKGVFTIDKTMLLGFCRIFSFILHSEYVHDQKLQDALWNNICDLYPELSDYEPKEKYTHSFWFAPIDYDARINILETILHRYSSTVKKISNE